MSDKITISPSNKKGIEALKSIRESKARLVAHFSKPGRITPFNNRAEIQATRILESLEEAKQIHAGKKSAISFEQFLNEL